VNISVFSIKRPVTISMIFGALMVLGIVSYNFLPVQLLPDFTVPTVGIRINNPQASTENTLENYTKPIEGIVSELQNVQEISSRTGTWGAWIRVDFDPGTDIRFVTLDLQERLNAFQDDAPDRRSSINVFPFTTDNFKNFLMEVSVEGEVDKSTLEKIARDQVAPRLRSVTGIARVETGGLTAKAATVEVDLDRLEANGVSIEAMFSRLNSAQIQETYLGDWGESNNQSYVRIEPTITTLEELAELPMDDKGIIRLTDVADLFYGNALDGWQYRANGRNAVGLQIEREEGANLIQTAQEMRARIDEINESLDGTINLNIQTDIAEIVQEVINDVSFLALQGALLALVIPLFFFRSLRVSLIIFISVPISMLVVFNLFSVFDMTINIFSVIGLALGVGILVDNSIVVVESILANFQEKGMNAFDSACRGSTDVGRALFASTLTTGAPFVGLVFLDGRFKSIIREPALALIFPLIVSLFVALTLSAMLTSIVLITKKQPEGSPSFSIHKLSGIQKFFRLLLRFSLRHKAKLLLTILGLLIFVFLEACTSIKQAATNDDESREVFRLYLVMPADTPTAPVAPAIRYVEEKLEVHPDIENFSVWYRQNRANFDIALLPSDERPSEKPIEEIRSEFIDYIGPYPGTSLSLENPEVSARDEVVEIGNTGTFSLKATNQESLDSFAEGMIRLLSLDPEITDVELVQDEELVLAELLPNKDLMQYLGITNQQLSQILGITQTGGTVTSLQLEDGEDRVDVSVTFKDGEVETLRDVMRLQAGSEEIGSRVAMSEITTMSFRNSDSYIRRENQFSTALVKYQWVDDIEADVITERIENIALSLPNPAGVKMSMAGKQLEIDNRARDFSFIMFVGFLLIYIVMAAAFESYWVPFTIIITNPLMVIGITMGLYFFDLPFEDLAAFGVILLIGLAVNNGIVMMDLAMRLKRHNHYSSLRAIYQASLTRVRPIMMTFSTTVAGMLPLAFGGDESSDWKPVAVTVIGGLTSATILTLVVLPAFYMLADSWMNFAKQKLVHIKSNLTIKSSLVFILKSPWLFLKFIFLPRPKPMAPEGLTLQLYDRSEESKNQYEFKSGFNSIPWDSELLNRSHQQKVFTKLIRPTEKQTTEFNEAILVLPKIEKINSDMKVSDLIRIYQNKPQSSLRIQGPKKLKKFRKAVKKLRRKKIGKLSRTEISMISLWIFLKSQYSIAILPEFDAKSLNLQDLDLDLDSLLQNRIIIGYSYEF